MYGDTVVSPGGQAFVDSISTISLFFGLLAFLCFCWQVGLVWMGVAMLKGGTSSVKVSPFPAILFLVFVCLAYVLR